MKQEDTGDRYRVINDDGEVVGTFREDQTTKFEGTIEAPEADLGVTRTEDAVIGTLLDGLPEGTVWDFVESQSVSGTTTLFDIDGPGTVTQFWMAFGSPGQITIEVDGETVFNQTWLQSFAPNAEIGPTTSTRTFAVGHVNGSHNGGARSLQITYPMPFESNIKIKTVGNNQVYSYVKVADGVCPNVRLHGADSGGLGAAQTLPTDGSETTLLSQSGSDGWLVYTADGLSKAGGRPVLERNFHVLDNLDAGPEVVAESPGWEDWFNGSWYYSGIQWEDDDRAAVPVNDYVGNEVYNICQVRDLLADGAIRFENGLETRVGGGATRADHFWGQMYYEEV